MRTPLVKLINDQGELINRSGFAEEGVGIYDFDHNEYPAGLDSNGDIHAAVVDSENNIYAENEEGMLSGWKLGANYSQYIH